MKRLEIKYDIFNCKNNVFFKVACNRQPWIWNYIETFLFINILQVEILETNALDFVLLINVKIYVMGFKNRVFIICKKWGNHIEIFDNFYFISFNTWTSVEKFLKLSDSCGRNVRPHHKIPILITVYLNTTIKGNCKRNFK